VNHEELQALAEIAAKAVEAASSKPLDIMLILSDDESVCSTSKMAASSPKDEGEQLRMMLRYYCNAISMIVEQCDTPEDLLEEIAFVLRRDSLAGKPS
jgi:hypothetical protein